MPRVVCPLCHTGFEASISRSNYAINCVGCGVAFNAASFLSKTEFVAAADRRPAPAVAVGPQNGTAALGNIIRPISLSGGGSGGDESGTQTARLPFMSDTTAAPAPAKPHETSLPVLLKAESAPRAVAAEAGAAHGPDLSAQPSSESASQPAPKAATSQSANVAAPAAPKPALTKPRANARRPLLEGSFGPYEIEGEIARGGVGAVFRARESDGGRLVALKVLLDGDEAGETERERFQHECETAKSLSLPGMVQVYAVGELEGKPYMAMELVDGRSLDKLIPEKSLCVNDCLVLMKSVAETIGALHEAGYVHRDLKPGNILIDAFGSPKVADFGLVKSLDEVTRMTASGLVCGTPAYMAPEQARGDGKAVDPRSDVWALGAVLYEMLTAQPPFHAENALRLMLKITKEQPRPPRVLNLKVPQDVQSIVLKCLEKNPERRYPTARALAEDVGRFLEGQPLEQRTEPRLQKLIDLALQNQRRVVAIGGGLAAVLLVSIVARLIFAPPQAAPLIEKGCQALNGGQLDLAERHFRDAVLAEDSNARAHLSLGLALGRASIQNGRVVDRARFDEAVSATSRAAELEPKLEAECHAQIAVFNFWQQLYDYETKSLEAAVKLAPANLEYRKRLGSAYWRLGHQSNTRKYYERALAEFQRIQSIDPGYPKMSHYIRQLQENFLAPSLNNNGSVALRSRGR